MADLQSISVALEALLSGVNPVSVEKVPLEAAAGRVLADDVMATLNVPPFDNSAMDGYALRVSDAGQWLPISQCIAAGAKAAPLAPGSCARIFTGGELPEGADCVVMQERVSVEADKALIPANIPMDDNVRRQGRDVRQGECLLKKGLRLEAAALGHLAGQGITHVSVRSRPRVALLSTGDEIVDPGTPLAPGQIYNSNRPMLKRLLENFGADVVRVISVPDDYTQTVALLTQAAAEADVVVSTGGVSVGEEDHVKAALEALGQLDLWRLAIRPGKPLALGRMPRDDGSEARFIGLPGNPVSGFVGAWLFLRPLMGALLACPALAELPTLTATANFDTSTGPRQHYMRVSLRFTPEGVAASAFADQNSGVLSSCIEADAFAVIPPHHQVRQGDLVNCLWLAV
ncbi:MAG: molybdopterin molybdotransferase MoeA [Halomonas sp.]|nr:gephyrin-like molybdotransferase Glp [Halomonas sp.]MBP5979939.1 molybdopterin molybdotransferase MoeA [Halomonas sp.]